MPKDRMPDRSPEISTEEAERDLHPGAMAGSKEGSTNQPDSADGQNAVDNKEVQRTHPGLEEAELKRLPIVPEGTRLDQGSTYYDLKHTGRGEFTAMGAMTAGQDNWYVAKNEVDYLLWNRLTGVTEPERLDQAPDQG